MARSKKKGSSVKVDFTGVKSSNKLPEGDYVFKVVKVTDEGDYLQWETTIEGGPEDGSGYSFRTYLTKESLWNLRNLLEAMGYEIPDGEEDLELDEFVDERFGGTIIHKEGNDGRVFANVTDYCPADEVEVEEADEKPAKGKKGKKEDEEEEEEKPAKKGGKKKKDDDDDEGEEKTPTGKGRKAGKKLEKLAGDEVTEMDEEELQGVVDKYDLDVDLDEFKTLRKKANAVVDALEEKGMLDD